MIKKSLNQNRILDPEILNSIDYDYIYNNSPNNRIQNKNDNLKKLKENKIERLNILKNKINSIEDCNLKKNSSQIVFSDGNIESSVMIVGEGPGQKEDEIGKPFVGDAGALLNKMLKAINIERNNVNWGVTQILPEPDIIINDNSVVVTTVPPNGRTTRKSPGRT